MPRPDLNRVPEFYHGYINKVKENDLIPALQNSTSAMLELLNSIPADKRDYRYGEDKWTIKEVVQHMMDAERVFAYRALRFSRKDDNKLPGFNENHFTKFSKAANRNWDEMIEEMKHLRKANELMFASFDNEQLEYEGIASDRPVYVLGIGFICAGHINHHCQVIKERYL